MYDCSPYIRNVKLEDITYNAIQATSSAMPYVYYVTVDGANHGAFIITYGDAVVKYSDMLNISSNVIDMDHTSSVDLSAANCNIYPSGGNYALDNPINETIYASANYWGTSSPQPNDLFSNPNYVGYIPYGSSTYNNGAPQKRAVLAEDANPFHTALEMENRNDITGAVRIYNDILETGTSIIQKRMAMKALIRVYEKHDMPFEELRTVISQQKGASSSLYDQSLELLYGDLFVKEGNPESAVDYFKELAENSHESSYETVILAHIAILYGEYMDDRATAKIYAEMSASAGTDEPILTDAFAAAGMDYADIEKPVAGEGNAEDQDAVDSWVQVFPNPANPISNITYSIAEPSHVTLDIFSITGQKVDTLVDDYRPAGAHTAVFDGAHLSSGLYLYRFRSESFSTTGRLMIVK